MPIIKRKTVSKPIYKIIPEREEALDKAIRYIKRCPYKGTAIKIELEALLGRTGRSSRECRKCDQAGELPCVCEGLVAECKVCKGRGYIVCEDCNGTGVIAMIAVTRSDTYCQKFILNHVSKPARDSLIFSKTYNDMSVDTEFTFTLPIDKARYAVEFIKAFAKLGEDIGNGIITQGAGMHIAILNDPAGFYQPNNDADHNHLDSRHTRNFIKSMTSMLPALYFLASPDEQSRRLGFRVPQISTTNKYSAIYGGQKCFEYRVFETCYQRPEAILDDICIIANTLKFYSYRQVRHSFFGKIGQVGFDDKSHGLQRFYRDQNSYHALMAGVKILRPSYKTIATLRKERNFKITLAKIKNKELLKENLWSQEYRSERKNIQELKEMYKAKYKGLATDPNFKQGYPTSTSYIKDMLPEVRILRLGKKQYIDDKKKGQYHVSKIINI